MNRGDLNVSTCPHCGKPIVTECYETPDGELVFGAVSTRPTVHVSVRKLSGAVACEERRLP